MLDERDLQAIAQLMDTKLAQQKAEIMHEVGALMEVEVIPKFNLLADGIQLIREQMVTKEDLEKRQEDIQTQLDVLKAAVRRNSVEIEKLKKAQ